MLGGTLFRHEAQRGWVFGVACQITGGVHHARIAGLPLVKPTEQRMKNENKNGLEFSPPDFCSARFTRDRSFFEKLFFAEISNGIQILQLTVARHALPVVLKIAQRLNAGLVPRIKSQSPVRDDRAFLSSLTGLFILLMEVLQICRAYGALLREFLWDFPMVMA